MLKKIFSNELYKGSIILIILLNLGNFFGYLFQFTMAQLLGPILYGAFAVVTNIILVFGVPLISIQTIVAKHTAKFNAQKNIRKIKGLFLFLIKKVMIIAIIIFFIFSLISLFLSKYLGISVGVLILTGCFIFGGFLQSIGLGILQGLKKFNALGFSIFVNGFFKFSIGVFLVLLGLKIYGAVLGFIFGIIISFIIALLFIKDVLKAKKTEEKIDIFMKNNRIDFFAMFIFVFIFSLDVIFAKAFFSPEIAGKYAVISMIGKIILFFTMAIGNVMLPINSEKFAKGHQTKRVFRKSVLLICLICGISLFFFLLFPELIVKILFGEEYISGSNILLYIGIAFSFISLINIFLLQMISTDKFKKNHLIIMILLLGLQIMIFSMFHKTIEQFSMGFMFSTIISFIGVLLLSKK